MGTRYISDHQVVEINYQREKRAFKIVSISASTITTTLEDSFEGLALDKISFVPEGWRVGWDSDVSLQQSTANNVGYFPIPVE